MLKQNNLKKYLKRIYDPKTDKYKEKVINDSEKIGLKAKINAGGSRSFFFQKTFDMLYEAKFPITVHAGEWDGPEQIRKAIKLLHPTRLGHGVRSIEDSQLVEEIIEKNITLETCPTSNVATNIYPDYVTHPVKKLFSKGVKLTVNSDDPPFFNASIQGEYDVMKELGLSDQELISLTKNAIESSFCDKDTKSKLLEKLN